MQFSLYHIQLTEKGSTMKCKSLKQTTLWTEFSDGFRAPRNATLSHDRFSAWTFWKLHMVCTNRLRQNKRTIQAVLIRIVRISPNCKRELYFMILLSIFCIRGLLVVIRNHAGEEHLPNAFCLDYGEDYIWSPLQHHSHTFSFTSKPRSPAEESNKSIFTITENFSILTMLKNLQSLDQY